MLREFFFVQRRVSTNSKDWWANVSANFLNSSLFSDSLYWSLGNSKAFMQRETCFLRLSTSPRIWRSFLSTSFNMSSSFIVDIIPYIYQIMDIQKLVILCLLLPLSIPIQLTNFTQFLLTLSYTNITHFTLLPFHKSSDTMVFMFAGLADGLPLDHLFLINLQEGTHEEFVGDPHPSARYKQCGVVDEYKLYIYGGYSQNGTTLTDLWMYDSVFMSWFDLGESGVQVQECSLLHVDETLYILGNNKTTKKSSVLKYDLSSQVWSVPSVSFVESLELEGRLWDGTMATTYVDIGYVKNIDESLIKGKIGKEETYYEAVCATSNGVESYMVTQDNIYKIDINLQEIEVVERRLEQNPSTECLISDEWLFIFYLREGQINIEYHSINNVSTHNKMFNVLNQTYVTDFSAFLDSQENIRIVIGDDLTSWILPKSCQNTTSNMLSCFYTQTICAEGYRGQNCDVPTCPNSLILYDSVNYGSIVFECSNHGTCTEGGCVCDEYWSGQDCSRYMRSRCEGQVIENWPVVNCECLEETSGGNYCEVTFCYNDCTGRGTCGSDGECACDSGYAGPDCSITVIQFL